MARAYAELLATTVTSALLGTLRTDPVPCWLPNSHLTISRLPSVLAGSPFATIVNAFVFVAIARLRLS